MSDIIGYDRDSAGIVTIAWNMPGRVNVLSSQSVPAFEAAVDRVLSDSAAIGAIVTSAKSDFIVGLDLNEVGPAGIAELEATIDAFHALTRRMETGGKPFVAALTGTALGGGAEIALACHHRIGVAGTAARFGCPEVTLGLLPGGGGTQRIPRLVGIMTALPLLLEGKRLTFEAAAKMGLIDELVPAADLIASARAWILANPTAKAPWDDKAFKFPGGTPQNPKVSEAFVGANAMLRKKTWGNYPATRAILSSVYEGSQLDIDSALRVEGRYFRSLLLGREAPAMIKTLFFAMNEANKLTGRPANVPKTTFNHVAVLGAGMMGAGIAYVTARAGAGVTLIDRDLSLADKGKAYSEKLLAAEVAKQRLSEADAAAILARIVPATSYDGLHDANLVIEAVFEDRAIKADVTKRSEAVLPVNAVFGSNTSTLPITGLAAASVRPERFIGIHFFSPVERMPLVEIIRGRESGDEALATALDYVRFIGKTPIVVNDSRGFFTSRVFATYVNEGLAMLAEGVPPALIENAGRLAGMAVGPLAVADEVSFSLMKHVLDQTRKDLGADYVASPADAPVELFATKLDRRGKGAGKGVYEYPAGGKKYLWPGLADHVAAPTNHLDVELVKRRLLFAQALEARRCLEEGVLSDPAMGDIGSILGWGFPAFTGGVFSYVDYIGSDAFEEQRAELESRYGARFERTRALAAR
jgi:3-hydroxyacyl-CoA dehydrogenase/enoyl-CoA hydratase/3-hydroxybutyryl-CoA epimerase